MKSIVAAIIISMSLAVSANAASQSSACLELASTASIIMKARQSGVTIVRALEISQGSAAVTAVVNLAYMKPRYQSDEYREIAAQEFEAEVYMLCTRKS